MHYFAVAIVPPTDDINAAVDTVMQPYDEETNEDGHWDWWVIGGRWTGVWAKGSPEDDPDNFEYCILCGGTGLRNDPIGAAHRAEHPEYTCNGCGHTGRPGQQLKHPADWKRDEMDVRPIADLLADAEAMKPHTFVTANAWVEREFWNGSSMQLVEDFDAQYAAALAAHPDHLAVVVDYHS